MNLSNIAALEFVQNEVPYFRFPTLSLVNGLIHGVFTRHGGVSLPPFDTLNVGDSVGDRSEDVRENIQIIRGLFGAKDVAQMNQSHGRGIFVLRQGIDRIPAEAPASDAMITNVPRVALLVKQADCQGVIIHDPFRKVVANVHCGWRGNVQNILGRVVFKMKEVFGCKGSDLLAAIGPSLGPCCAEFVGYQDLFPEKFDGFMAWENHFDLWAVSCRQLEEAGLEAKNIEIAGICTRCRPDLFYSFRGEGKTGRFGSVVMLR